MILIFLNQNILINLNHFLDLFVLFDFTDNGFFDELDDDFLDRVDFFKDFTEDAEAETAFFEID
jgi:hypothetical protein